MTSVTKTLSPVVFQKFPKLAENYNKILQATEAQEQGLLKGPFWPYASHWTNNVKKFDIHPDLKESLQEMSKRVHRAANKSIKLEFQHAIEEDDLFSTRSILRFDPNLLKAPLSNGETPLNFAIRSECRQVVQLFLKECPMSLLQQPDGQGYVPIDIAFLKRDRKTQVEILSAMVGGVKIPEKGLGEKVDEEEMKEMTKAATEILALPFSKFPYHKWHPLCQAAFSGDDLSRLLAQCDPNMKDSQGRSPLHFAALGGQVEAVQRLLKRGATISADKNGMTPIHFCVINGSKKSEAILQMLLEQNHSNVLVNQKITPLHFALQFGRLSLARLLLAHQKGGMESQTMKTTPVALLKDLAFKMGNHPSPLKFSYGSVITSAAMIAAALARHWYGNADVSDLIYAILGYHTIRNFEAASLWQIPASIIVTQASSGAFHTTLGTMGFEGGYVLWQAKTWLDQVEMWKKNIIFSPFRTALSILLQSTSVILPLLELLFTAKIDYLLSPPDTPDKEIVRLLDSKLNPKDPVHAQILLGCYGRPWTCKRNYRDLSLKYHPDKSAKSAYDTIEISQRINTAHDTIFKGGKGGKVDRGGAWTTNGAHGNTPPPQGGDHGNTSPPQRGERLEKSDYEEECEPKNFELFSKRLTSSLAGHTRNSRFQQSLKYFSQESSLRGDRKESNPRFKLEFGRAVRREEPPKK